MVVKTVDTDDLLTSSGVAQRLGVTSSTLSNWFVRYAPAPSPFYESAPAGTPGRAVLWVWPEIELWVRQVRPDALD